MGFNPPATEIPSGYKWLYAITPHTYSVGIMGALVFSDCDNMPTWDNAAQQYVGGGSQLGCQPVTNTPVNIDHITVKECLQAQARRYLAQLRHRAGLHRSVSSPHTAFAALHQPPEEIKVTILSS
ncbi:hypothetical protein PI125_g13159 [Phytophthora idaei]|nr:hypothetical protein PI125_g13159 [Phytophthora idaei]KAG3149077.1 hypothetical protein PI126_g12204 [Phytophthora idaei]